jgi:hypothetical protein
MDLSDTPDDVPDPDRSPPEFDDWESPESLLQGGPVRERLYDVILQLRTPTKVATVADRAGCDTETARDYLQWFAEMGMVSEHPGRPVRYERNDSYFRWRRVNRFREAYSDEELVGRLGDVLDRIETYRERFDAETPDEVSLVEASRTTSTEDAWEALSEWETLERRAELLDAARRAGETTSSPTDGIDA